MKRPQALALLMAYRINKIRYAAMQLLGCPSEIEKDRAIMGMTSRREKKRLMTREYQKVPSWLDLRLTVQKESQDACQWIYQIKRQSLDKRCT